MAKRKPPLPPKLDRRDGTIAPRYRITIFCEGRNTEPDYFTAFARHVATPLTKVICVRGGGVPLTLVQTAIQCRKDDLAAKKDSFFRFNAYWVVFDKDEHPNLAAAFAQARQGGIKVAFSNPCFELWPLLHLAEFDQPLGRHAMQKRLAQDLPGFHPDQGKNLDFALLAAGYDAACKRAAKLRQRREEEGDAWAEPYTDVDVLTHAIAHRPGKRDHR